MQWLTDQNENKDKFYIFPCRAKMYVVPPDSLNCAIKSKESEKAWTAAMSKEDDQSPYIKQRFVTVEY